MWRRSRLEDESRRVPIQVPPLGGLVEDAEFIRWVRQVGDTVVRNDQVAEVETEKALVGIVVIVGGRIVEHCVEAGRVQVGATIGFLESQELPKGFRARVNEITIGRV